MIVYPKRYAIFDTETSGLDVTKDEIVELGVKIVEKDGSTATKTWLLQGTRPSCPEALATHGITEADRAEHGVDPKQAFWEFIEMVGTLPLVGHNLVRYDNPLLAANMDRHGFDSKLMQKKFDASVDTAALHKALKLKEGQRWYEDNIAFYTRVLDIKAPGVRFALSVACKDHGIDTSDVIPHRVAGDVELVHRLFIKLTA